MARRVACRVHTGLHAALRISRQISPVDVCTLGWNILVVKRTVGG